MAKSAGKYRLSRSRPSTAAVVVLSAVVAILLLGACGGDGDRDDAGAIVLDVWFHTGQEAERRTIEDQVGRFNRRHAATGAMEVRLTMLPEGSYNAQVQAAALAGDLPDLLELDGPYVANYAWQGHLVALEGLLSEELQNDLLPSIIAQGLYGVDPAVEHLYAVGTFDSGLGLWARRSRLEAAGVRIPGTPAEAWTVAELRTVLTALAAQDEDGAVLDLKLNQHGEWLTYAFAPVIQSAGADLIGRGSQRGGSAEGTLNSPAARAALEEVQSWITAGYVDANVDDAAFVTGRVALSWVGHWEFRRYAQSAGDDLILLPLPDFGAGSRTGQGSWAWAVTTACDHREAAVRFLEFLLEPAEVLAMAGANGAIPATRQAVAASQLYGEGGRLRLFVTQIEDGRSVPRPRTPAYPVITAAFQQAALELKSGGDLQVALDRAAAEIDEELRDNRGYGRGDDLEQ